MFHHHVRDPDHRLKPATPDKNGNSSHQVFGLVLAGGQSLRMGTNKARLKLWGKEGPTLLEHTVSLLAAVTGAYAVSCAPGQAYAGHPCVQDMVGIRCPAAGLLSGLGLASRLGYPTILSLPCDLPAMRQEPLENLLQTHFSHNPRRLATLYISPLTRKIEMLAGLYTTEFLPLLHQGIARGEKSIFKMLPQADCTLLPLPMKWLNCFHNCNSLADLAVLGCQQSACH